jgi:hypothetical protein
VPWESPLWSITIDWLFAFPLFSYHLVQDSLIQWRRDSMFNSSCHSINVVRLTVAAGVTLVAGLLVSAPALGAITHLVETQPNFTIAVDNRWQRQPIGNRRPANDRYTRSG